MTTVERPEQKTTTTSMDDVKNEGSNEDSDDAIQKMSVRQLKAYIKDKRPELESKFATITEKIDLLWMAMDLTAWHKQRLESLTPPLRRKVVDKLVQHFGAQYDATNFDAFLGESDDSDKVQVVEQIVNLLKTIEEAENSHNQVVVASASGLAKAKAKATKKKAATNDDDEDEDAHSDVSTATHASMPSLITDNDSDEDDDDEDGDDDDEDEDDFDKDEDDDVQAAAATKIAEEASKKRTSKKDETKPKTAQKKKKNENDDKDFLKSFGAGFLTGKNNKKKKGANKDKNKSNDANKNKNKPKPAAAKKPDANQNSNDKTQNDDKDQKKPNPTTSATTTNQSKDSKKASTAENKEDEEHKNERIVQQLLSRGYSEGDIKTVSLEVGPDGDVDGYLRLLSLLESQKASLPPPRATAPATAVADNAAPETEVKEAEEQRLGYTLQPDIDGKKDANGTFLVCMNPRKVRPSLDKYRYLKCWVSLKKKPHRKRKKESAYHAVLIDLRAVSSASERNIERNRLKTGYEFVLSFELTANHSIADVLEERVRRVGVDKAFAEFAHSEALRKESKSIAKLVTAGFNDDEARKAVEMSNTTSEAKTAKLGDREDDQTAPPTTETQERDQKQVALLEPEPEQNGNVQEQKQQAPLPAKPEPAAAAQLPAAAVAAVADEVTLEMLNACTLHTDDLLGFVNDDSGDDMMQGFYVRIAWQGTQQYRVHRIEKCMHYPQLYLFRDRMISKGLTVSYGKKITPQRLSNVSDEAITEQEMRAWKERVLSTNQALPSKETLRERMATRCLVREIIESAVLLDEETVVSPGAVDSPGAAVAADASPPTTTTTTTTVPASPLSLKASMVPAAAAASNNKHNINSSSSTLNHFALQQFDMQNQQHQFNRFLLNYFESIDKGHTTFYCIPTQRDDSQFVAFLLSKSSKMKPVLQAGIELAQSVAAQQCQVPRIDYVEIRESKPEEDASQKQAKDGCWRAKGYLIDAKTTACAHTVLQHLSYFIAGKNNVPLHPTNFVRQVLQEFGTRYMSIQLLAKALRPAVSKEHSKKPQGPRFPYKDGEKSTIEDMVSAGIEIYGEDDHGTVTSSQSSAMFRQPVAADRMSDIESVTSYKSYRTNTKYDHYSHMTFPNQPGHALNPHAQKPHHVYAPPSQQRDKVKKRKVTSVAVRDEVMFEKAKYEVTLVMKDRIVIQNELLGSKTIKKDSKDWQSLYTL